MSPTKQSLPLRNRFMADQRGGIAVMTAVAMVPFLVAAGSAVDMGMANRTMGQMQKAVDSAALAGAATNLTIDNAIAQSPVEEEAKIEAAVRMVAANLPPAIAATAADPEVSVDGNVVTVSLDVVMPTLLMKIVGIDEMSLRTTAAAEAAVKANGCVLALGPNGDGIEVGGTVDFAAENCWLYSNKEGDDSIDIFGDASVNAPGTCSVGSTSVSNNGTRPGETYTNCRPMIDPMADWEPPVAPSGCDYNNFRGGGGSSITLSPGTYCNGVRLNGYDHVHFEPGIYHMTDGAVTINSKVSLTGEGVGIHIGEDVSSLTINGDATVNLSAATDGPMAGMLIGMDPLAPGEILGRNEPITARINGGADLGIAGTIYLPSANLDFVGNSATLSSPTQIIAYSVDLSGTSALNVQLPLDESGNPIGFEFMTVVRLIK